MQSWDGTWYSSLTIKCCCVYCHALSCYLAHLIAAAMEMKEITDLTTALASLCQRDRQIVREVPAVCFVVQLVAGTVAAIIHTCNPTVHSTR